MTIEMGKDLPMQAMRECPRCWDDLVDKKNKLEQKVVNLYGKIPKDEYLELVEESRKAITASHSLKENYEIKTEKNGKFSIGYKCQCLSCGWFFDFNHEEQVKIYE